VAFVVGVAELSRRLSRCPLRSSILNQASQFDRRPFGGARLGYSIRGSAANPSRPTTDGGKALWWTSARVRTLGPLLSMPPTPLQSRKDA